MLIAPSDHLIADTTDFHKSVAAALPAAKTGQLVTFGIHPKRAETGYGWLELSSPITDDALTPQPLRSFVEKPDQLQA